MQNTIRRHIGYYTVLVVILVVGLAAYFSVGPTANNRFLVATITAVAYVLWGIFHHAYEHDLNWKIVLEYSVFSLFVLSILWLSLYS